MNTKETKLTKKGLMERKDSSPNKKHKWPINKSEKCYSTPPRH